MHKRLIKIFMGLILFGISAGSLALLSARTGRVQHFNEATRPARIFPDYGGAVIPPNIAPLNFEIRDPGIAFAARISSRNGEPIEIPGKGATVSIPGKPWQRLLSQNRGEEIRIEIFVKTHDGQWTRPEPVTLQIASEDIDPHVIYRKMFGTPRQVRGAMRICSRNLADFDESVLLSSSDAGNACLNCHTFPRNNTDEMLIGIRSPHYGTATLLVEGDSVQRIDKKFGYTSWHPAGKLAAYSINNLPMFYHTSRDEIRDTVDLDSMLAFYRSDTKTNFTIPQLSRKERLENWPTWSADGRYLYYCSAPKLWADDAEYPPVQYDQVRYDLMRIPYDSGTGEFGEPETVLSSKDTGKSVSMPQCSPDGQWLTFCMCDHGYFPAWQEDSDIFLMALHGQAGPPFRYERLDLNSNKSESWHTWSSNSRWLVFSSKSLHGYFTRLFIAYIDSQGKAHKAIVLPQEDPCYYESSLEMFNTAALVTQPPQVSGEKLTRAIREAGGVPVNVPGTGSTPVARPAPQNIPGESQRD